MNEVRMSQPAAVPANTSSAGPGGKPQAAANARQSQQADVEAVQRAQVEAEKAAADEAVSQAVADLNKYLQFEQRDLRFSIDDGSGQVVVRVVNRDSGELIRQIPNDVTLELAAKARLNEPLQLVNVQG